MPEFWKRFEGLRIANSYVLGDCARQEEDTAYFTAAAPGTEGERAVVRLAAGEGAAAQLALWRRIAALSHANLVRILDTGRIEEDGPSVCWAALEFPDENLADVLGERALTLDESRAVLPAACEALEYLHGQGLVHGRVAAESIVAVGDDIKLTSDGLRAAEAGRTAAEDIRSLGLTACEIMTRRRPEVAHGEPQLSPEEASVMEPLREFVRRCLLAGHGEDWSAARLRASLREPVAAEAAKETVPPAKEEPRGGAIEMPVRAAPPAASFPRWAYAAAAVVAGLGALLLGSRYWATKPAPDPPAAVTAPAAASAPAQAAPAPADSGSADPQRRWRVIAYTYNSATPARNKADTINRRFPDLNAEVFSPKPDGGPYMVALGGRMARDEAVRLQRAARSKGLPRDTFVRNYGR